MKKCILWLLIFCLAPSALAAQYFNQLGWLESDNSLYPLLQYPTVVEDIYRNNKAQMIWSDLQQSSKLEFQLEIIHQANFSPLFSRQLSYLQFYRKSHRWQEYDVLATDTLLLYLSYAENSKTEGNHWFFEKKTMDSLPLPSEDALLDIDDAIASQSLDDLIAHYTPDNPQYQYLIDSYLHLNKFYKHKMPKYTQTGVARRAL